MRIISGQSVAKMIIILTFWVSTTKNKNIDQVRDTCAIVSIKVTYKTYHTYSVIQQCQVHNVLVFLCTLLKSTRKRLY